MHPAYSVILFTTASGAGYGLLVWLALGRILGWFTPTPWLGFWAFGLALGLISVGLLSSTFHLGRPERAWRAFSQWRSSWLSREGVAAVAAYGPSGLLALAWLFPDDVPAPMAMVALEIATILLALVTVYCTGMIYASLPTIPEWHLPRLVPAIYLMLALASGAVLLIALLWLIEGTAPGSLTVGGASALATGLALKQVYWRSIDTRIPTLTAESATGLGHIGRVRPLDPPHTEPNYIMREMGYRVARKHADKLRRLATILAFMTPLLLLVIGLALPDAVAATLAVVAVAAVAAGLVVERWLFFAEAQHVVTLYYGAERG